MQTPFNQLNNRKLSRATEDGIRTLIKGSLAKDIYNLLAFRLGPCLALVICTAFHKTSPPQCCT